MLITYRLPTLLYTYLRDYVRQLHKLLIHDLQHYYKVKRRLLMLRKQKVMQQYDALEITEQCKALKETFTKTKHNCLISGSRSNKLL